MTKRLRHLISSLISKQRTAPDQPLDIAIYGQYKTGTTAIFSLVKRALANKPRIEFEPIKHIPHSEDKKTGVLAKVILKFPGHPEPVDYESFRKFDKHIYITRDPRDWLVSGALFLTQEKTSIYHDADKVRFVVDYLRKKESSPASFPLINLLTFVLESEPGISLIDFAKRTQAQHRVCMEFEGRLTDYLQVTYEDFVDQRWRSMSDYLGVEIHQPAPVDDRFGHVKRSATYDNWKSWLTDEDIDFFKPYFQPYIDYYKYQKEWDLDPMPALNPQHGSDYVYKTVAMKLEKER